MRAELSVALACASVPIAFAAPQLKTQVKLIERGLDELEKSFSGSEADLSSWRKLWGGGGEGRFFAAKNGRRYDVEFDFAEPVKDAEATKRAWALVEGRDVSADFLAFWTKYRKHALNAR